MTDILMIRREDTEKQPGKMRVETGVILLPAKKSKDCWPPPEAGKNLVTGFPSGLQKEPVLDIEL